MRYTANRRRCILFALSWLVLTPALAQEKLPDTSAVTQKIVQGTNRFRQAQNRRKIERNAQLTAAALDFARFMATSGKYGHTADGRGPEDRAKQHGYDYCIVAENIAYLFSSKTIDADELARRLVHGWENSPGHRKNMLSPDVTQIGVGVARSEKSGYYYAVQLFGRPRSDAISFHVTNETTVAVSYALGNRSLSLPPGTTRTHQQCGLVELKFHWPDNQRSPTLAPRNGDRYAVVRENSGKYRLNKK